MQRIIVAGYDFSYTGHAALTRAVTLASDEDAVLHVVCVVDPRDPLPSIPSKEGVDYRYAARVQDALGAVVAEECLLARPARPVSFFVHTRIGKPAEEIVELAREIDADLVVVGTHGLRSLERLLIGSVSAKVTRDATCSVEVVRGERAERRASLKAWRSSGSPTTHR